MSTATTQPLSTAAAMGMRPPPIYEFSKRKRWGDLLLNELVDDITFILSPRYKILYCGPAVTELLGWREMDLSDLDFIDLVDPADHARFQVAFEEAVRTNTEFDLAVRLTTNKSTTQHTSASAQGVLFDIKFYPHVTSSEDEENNKCIFAMASPYPSRNTAMLETSLGLRAENERLQQKVMEYRNRLPAETVPSKNAPPSQATSMYATSSLSPPRHAPSVSTSGPIVHNSNEAPGAFSPSALMSEPFNVTTSNASAGMDFGKSLYTAGPNLDDQVEEGSKKKKLKRAQNAEQYVCITCGRTDSPEWRKGPLGPKTLCNACGLRWAKEMRKVNSDQSGDGVNLSSAPVGDS